MNVETAADTLIESPYGIHALIIYSDMVTLREFLSFYTKKGIEEKEEIVCLAPFYDTVDLVRKTLSEGHMSIDVLKYEKEWESLIIIDSLEKYLDKGKKIFDVGAAVKANEVLVKCANLLNKKGISILEDMGPFLFMDKVQSLVDYELALPTEFNVNLKGVCLDHHRDFNRLSAIQKKKIIKQHDFNQHLKRDCEYTTLTLQK